MASNGLEGTNGDIQSDTFPCLNDEWSEIESTPCVSLFDSKQLIDTMVDQYTPPDESSYEDVIVGGNFLCMFSCQRRDCAAHLAVLLRFNQGGTIEASQVKVSDFSSQCRNFKKDEH